MPSDRVTMLTHFVNTAALESTYTLSLSLQCSCGHVRLYTVASTTGVRPFLAFPFLKKWQESVQQVTNCGFQQNWCNSSSTKLCCYKKERSVKRSTATGVLLRFIIHPQPNHHYGCLSCFYVPSSVGDCVPD